MTVLTQQKTADPERHVINVSFTKVGKLYQFYYHDFPDLNIGDNVIVETKRLGHQMGEIKGFTPLNEIKDTRRIYDILRPATASDLLINQQWKEREVSVLIDCREYASAMPEYRNTKFVNAEYNFNGSVLTIFYTNENRERINTFPIRNAMKKQLNTRIELRMIGPRDVAKLQGGFGSCGIPRCCSTFLTEFSQVTVAMAREQGISLSPSEITGVCGRLRCCLSYEYKQYVEARKKLPKIRKRVGTEWGIGRVVEHHPMKDAVTVLVDEEFHVVQREAIKPLAEWEALKAAAAAPCGKNSSGGCDCGSKRPRGTTNDLMAEMNVGASPSDGIHPEASENKPNNEDKSQRSGSSRRRRRRKGNKPNHKNNNTQQQNTEDNKNKSSRGGSRRGRRGGRRRGNKDNKSNDNTPNNSSES